MFLFRIVMRMHFLNELPEYELAIQHVQTRGSPLHFGLSHHIACVKFNDLFLSWSCSILSFVALRFRMIGLQVE